MSCLSPPPVPEFGSRNDSGKIIFQNYFADWFTLEFQNNTDNSINHTHYRVTREQRARLWQPWMKYDATEENETSLEFIATTRKDHFNDVYQIMPNDSVAIYTCPNGWVFNNSNNISHTARCLNWTEGWAILSKKLSTADISAFLQLISKLSLLDKLARLSFSCSLDLLLISIKQI